MKRLLPVLACFLLLLLSSTEGRSADFQKGLDAYKSGDYGTAMSEWEPLAKDLVFNPLGEEGNARPQWGLGMMYENGHGVTQNYKTAVKWYKLSASQGYAPALSNLKRLQKKIAAEAERKAEKVKVAQSPPNFEGYWRGVMKCGVCRRNPCGQYGTGPFSNSISILIRDKKISLASGIGNDLGGEHIDGELKINDDEVKVSIWGSYSRRTKIIDFKGEGSTTAFSEELTLSGRRGPRDCKLSVRRTKLPAQKKIVKASIDPFEKISGKLDGSKIKLLFSGLNATATVQGFPHSFSFSPLGTAYYADKNMGPIPGGRVEAENESEKVVGKWWVKGDKACTSKSITSVILPLRPEETCWSIRIPSHKGIGKRRIKLGGPEGIIVTIRLQEETTFKALANLMLPTTKGSQDTGVTSSISKREAEERRIAEGEEARLAAAEAERKRKEEETRLAAAEAERKRKEEKARIAAAKAERKRKMIVSAQKALSTLGLYKGKADGQFGKNSLAALGGWLERHGHKKTTPLDETIVEELEKAVEVHVARLAAEADARRLADLKRKQIEAETRRLVELERKRKDEEARRLAELKRKRIEAEARRLIELERKRKEEEAQRLAEAERQEEEARLAAVEAERKRKVEEARLAEAERKVEEARLAVLEAERKRKEAERKRKAEAEQKLFAKFESQAVAHLNDVQAFIKEKPTSPNVLAMLTMAVGLKKSLETKNGDAIRAQIKVFREKVEGLSDFIEFRKLLVAKREQAAKELAARKAKEAEELAAKKAREEALIIAEMKRKMTTYKQKLVKLLSESLSKDSSMAEALIPIIQKIEVGVKNTGKSEISRVLVSVEEQMKANKKIKIFIEGSSKSKAQGKIKASSQPVTKIKEAEKTAVRTNFLIGMCVSWVSKKDLSACSGNRGSKLVYDFRIFDEKGYTSTLVMGQGSPLPPMVGRYAVSYEVISASKVHVTGKVDGCTYKRSYELKNNRLYYRVLDYAENCSDKSKKNWEKRKSEGTKEWFFKRMSRKTSSIEAKPKRAAKQKTPTVRTNFLIGMCVGGSKVFTDKKNLTACSGNRPPGYGIYTAKLFDERGYTHIVRWGKKNSAQADENDPIPSSMAIISARKVRVTTRTPGCTFNDMYELKNNRLFKTLEGYSKSCKGGQKKALDMGLKKREEVFFKRMSQNKSSIEAESKRAAAAEAERRRRATAEAERKRIAAQKQKAKRKNNKVFQQGLELVCKGRSPGSARKPIYIDCSNRQAVVFSLKYAWQTLRKQGIRGTMENMCWKPYQRASKLHPSISTNGIAETFFAQCNTALMYVRTK